MQAPDPTPSPPSGQEWRVMLALALIALAAGVLLVSLSFWAR